MHPHVITYPLQPSYEYECQLSDGMSNYNIPGVHGSNYVTCFIPADHLSVPNSDIVPVSINVTFGNRTIFTDTLQLYSCVEQGTTCAQCLSNRQEKPLCVWCVASPNSDSDSDTCAISSLCQQGDALTESCPAPFITSVSCKQQQQQQQLILSRVGVSLCHFCVLHGSAGDQRN